MKTIDMRFDESIIKSWIGKKFKKYQCDPFDFTNSVTQIVGLFIDNKIYALTNKEQSIDYFGNQEDIAVFELTESENSQIKSAFEDTKQIITPIDGTITKIQLINENQKILKDGALLYNVWLTRVIIFFVGGREISFEKDEVPFSEEIVIRRGYDLENRVSGGESFLDGWNVDVVPEYHREIVTIA